MALTKGPLLSLSARGKLDKSLIYQDRKGIGIVKSYATPTYPGSPAQENQRSLVAQAISAWQNYLTASVVTASWSFSVSTKQQKMSGYNLAVQNMLSIFPTDPDASFVWNIWGVDFAGLDFGFKNMDDGAEGDESGNCQVFGGTTPHNMVLKFQEPIAEGGIQVGPFGGIGDTVYAQVFLNGIARTGIVKWKLLL